MSEFRRRLLKPVQNWIDIEYIGANGKDYLILDYKPNINTELYIEYYYMPYGNMPLYDATDWNVATASKNRCVAICGNSVLYIALGDYKGLGAAEIPQENQKKVYININFRTTTATTPQATFNLANSLDVNGFTSSDFLRIFERNDTHVIANNILIYKIIIKENDNVIASYIPFKDSIGNGLVNIKNGTKFYSVNGGKFIEGPEL